MLLMKAQSFRTSDDRARTAAASERVKSATSLRISNFDLRAILGDAHVELRGALRDCAVIRQPGQPLPMRERRLGLEEQIAGRFSRSAETVRFAPSSVITPSRIASKR